MCDRSGGGGLGSPTSTKGVDVTRGDGAMGRGGDAAILVRDRVRRSEFKLVSEQGAARGRGCR